MRIIDEEVRRIIQEAEARAIEHLTTHRKKLELLARALIKREELNKDEVDLLLKTESLDSLPPIILDEPTPTPIPPAKISEVSSPAESSLLR